MIRQSDHKVRAASAAEIAEIAEVLGEAFERDPFNQWIFPDVSTRSVQLTDLMRRLTERSVESGAIVDVIDDVAPQRQEVHEALAAVALWDPPGVAVPHSRKGLREEVVQAFEQIYSAQPKEAHWYLDVIGARVGGQGYGSALMQHRLNQVDAMQMPAALWTATDANVRLYVRHGFEVVNEVQFGGPVHARWLWRQAR